MKITTLNLHHGGGQRVDLCIEYLIATQSDVLVLTEFRNNKNATKLKYYLRDHGFNFFHTPVDGSINSVLIATRAKSNLNNIKDLSTNDKHRACLVTHDDIKILGVYFAQKNEKLSLFKTILDDANTLLNHKSLVIGDFNTGLPYKDETQKSFYCAKEFEQLLDLGFIDAWRSRNPNKYEYSWYSQSESGFRIDHALASSKFNSLIQSIRYDHTPREQKITDHSALIIKIKK